MMRVLILFFLLACVSYFFNLFQVFAVMRYQIISLVQLLPLLAVDFYSLIASDSVKGQRSIFEQEWAKDRWNPLYYTIRVEQVALPLYPQWGTEPNGFYIPPRQAPRGYIRQMFGPGVDNAIEKYLVPSRELLAVLQLWRASQQIIFRYDVIPGPKVFETQIHGKKFEMYNDTVLGFNKSGKEAVRQQVEEPIYIRPAERVTWL